MLIGPRFRIDGSLSRVTLTWTDTISPPTRFKGYLCFSHVLHVKPVIRKATKPDIPHPGIVHLASATVDDKIPILVYDNVDEIVSLHKAYWGAGSVVIKRSGSGEEGGPASHGGQGGGPAYRPVMTAIKRRTPSSNVTDR